MLAMLLHLLHVCIFIVKSNCKCQTFLCLVVQLKYYCFFILAIILINVKKGDTSHQHVA